MGAVTGDHSFLKIVTRATTKPPIAPPRIHGPATAGSSAVRTCAHTHAAGTTTRSSRNAVLFIVPSTVMAGAAGGRRGAVKVLAFRAGVDGRSQTMALLFLPGGASTSNNVPD